MDVVAFLHNLIALHNYKDQIIHTEHVLPGDASFGKLNRPLADVLQTRLDSLGLPHLYRHQAEALNAIDAGDNVIVSTPSASGKSLVYQLATLDAMLSDYNSCALYLFPTKALAQDQIRSLQEMACPDLLPLRAIATFDGDTPSALRSSIRRQARIVVTNPDMLHFGILPNHQSWSRLLRHLKYVVIDEAHVYRGVFGSHVANILRRLQRICALYGAHPQFICCSATIANPQQHAQALVGLPVTPVARDASPHGERYFVFWNPPFIDEADNNRASSNEEAAFLLSELVKNDIRSLVFTRTRRLTELIYLYARNRLSPSMGRLIAPYRAGYLPEERREIEHQIFTGSLTGLVATTALELGIDIGDLDATVLTGYPGSIASVWQQAGRSGRSDCPALSLLIAADNPLDQYIMTHPHFLFSGNFERALIDPDNHYILSEHLICAAWERPLTDKDEQVFGSQFQSIVSSLEQEGRLRQRRKLWYLSPATDYPARNVNIRSSSGRNYAIIDMDSNTIMETVEASVAFSQVHPGAIYLHRGESYMITELDIASRVAVATPSAGDYYTQARETTDLRIVTLNRKKECHGVQVCFGDVNVTTTVVSFSKRKQFTAEVIEEQPLDLPSQSFVTKALWFDLPEDAVRLIAQEGRDFYGGIHACEHAAIGVLPLFALCDRNDIGGVSTPLHPDTGKAQIFIYDAYPGGVGIVERGYELVAQLWQATLDVVSGCPCSDGCPRCIQSPKCGNNNQPLDKKASIMLLRLLVACQC
ncbi:MAG: DEAD/DEAH box helicase [Dehalococcoidia bacterium]|nr:DEAD/DEAH box helicase [Dehalococcoidia bacterium]